MQKQVNALVSLFVTTVMQIYSMLCQSIRYEKTCRKWESHRCFPLDFEGGSAMIPVTLRVKGDRLHHERNNEQDHHFT